MAETRSRVTAQMVLGVCVIVLGLLWTLDNFDILESEPILQWWPLIVIAAGVAKLFGVGTPRHLAGGGIITAVGLWLLADSLDYFDISIGNLWPLVLVFVGYNLLRRGLARPVDPTAAGASGTSPGTDPTAVIQSFAFMSGVDRKIGSQEFRGGEATAIMGGIELDLRPAKPVPGGAVLNLFAMWGGVDITVPDHWKVVNECTALLGGVEDKSRTPPPDAQDVLIVRGLVVMGGVEIKN